MAEGLLGRSFRHFSVSGTGRLIMRNGMKFFAVLVLAVFSAGGCVVSRSEGDVMQEDIRANKMEIAKLKEAQAADRKEIEAQVQKTQTKATDLENALENVKKTYGTNVANFGLEQDKIIQKLMELNGKYDLSSHRIEELEAELKKLKDEGTPAKSVKTGDPQKKVGEGQPEKMAEIKRPEKKKDYFNLGLKLFNDGQWEASRIIFREYIDNFKGDAACGKAQYYIGESYFRDGKYQNAVLEFQKVLTNYPQSEKIEDASYELALSFAQIGLADDAKKLLAEFVKAYPNSKLTPKAKRKIEELSKGRK
jgi:tol-pal system protein YbgF